MTAWAPVIAALAGMIVALTPAVVALVQAYAVRARVTQLADGVNNSLNRVVGALERLEAGRQINMSQIADIHRRLDTIGGPLSPGNGNGRP